MQSAPNRISIVVLCAVFALCIYRAATQSFTIDESFTFLHFVNVPIKDCAGGVFGQQSHSSDPDDADLPSTI